MAFGGFTLDLARQRLESLDGRKVPLSDAEALCQIAEMTGKGEGFGKDIGLGSKRLCEKYGRPELSMAVKGQEFAAYDGRAMQGMGLAYATSNRGACHLRANPYAHDFGSTETAGKAEVVKTSQDLIAAIDSTGLCVFTLHAGVTPEHYASQVDAACGGGWTVERLQETGEREVSSSAIGEKVMAHVPNSGSMKGCAEPGWPVARSRS